MTEILSSAQMRAIEVAAIESGRVTGPALMERAGQGVVQAIFDEWPSLRRLRHGRAALLCGPGNNGGDGYVIARLLAAGGHGRSWQVDVFAMNPGATMPPDAQANRERCTAAIHDAAGFDASVPYDLLIDAGSGIGLSRPLQPGPQSAFLDAVHRATRANRAGQNAARTVAVDVPSGLCADTGRVLGQGTSRDPFRDPFQDPGATDTTPDSCAPVQLTVTFHRAKPGHFLERGPQYCGKLVVADIGLNEVSTTDDAGRGQIGASAPLLMLNRAPPRTVAQKPLTAHKFDQGAALILSGPALHTGAARLAARAALRVGAGVVTIGATGAALAENAAHLTAIMQRDIPDAAALAKTLEDRRWRALCIGPALGLNARAAALVDLAVASGVPCVLDADALTLLAGAKGLERRLHRDCVLTPHWGEFTRLFPDLAEKLAPSSTTIGSFSRMDAVRAAAQRCGATVLLKGHDTVIGDPSGAVILNAACYDRAAPWLATAGSGDVLAGLACGLMARGFGATPSAAAAAWLHTEAGRSAGPGCIAEDLPEQMPRVLAGLLAE